MQTDAEVATIAAKLTRAQREWLVAQVPSLDEQPVTPSEEWWDGPSLYVSIDEADHWLGGRSMCSPAGSATFVSGETHLYPLGLAVRDHLLSETRA